MKFEVIRARRAGKGIPVCNRPLTLSSAEIEPMRATDLRANVHSCFAIACCARANLVSPLEGFKGGFAAGSGFPKIDESWKASRRKGRPAQ